MESFKDVGLNENKTVSSDDVEKLDDYHETSFKGGTLTLSQDSDVSPLHSGQASATNITPSGNGTEFLVHNDDHSNANVENENAKNAARSATAHRPSTSRPLTEEDVKEFFAVRDGALENAAEQCRPVLLENLDGDLRGMWLLTEIDHWDNEKERLIFLNDFTLIVLKYDFITLKLLDYKRYPLKQFESIMIGELKYPENSLMPPRNQLGVRCIWNKDEPLPLLKRWNPWSKEIPWITFTSHPLITHEGRHRPSYDIEDFSKKLTETIQQLDVSKAPPTDAIAPKTTVEIVNQPVIIENYAGIGAVFHNANNLGFFKARGKVSF